MRALSIALAALAMIPTLAHATPARAAALPEGAADRLREADANGDGAISRAELGAWRVSQWQRMDRNGDGAFSRDDLPALMRSRWDSDRLVKLRQVYDRNGDGRISRTEFVDGPAPAFEAADTNRDGVVSAQEMRALKARKVG
ncbi:EF-hand domain-containing protein [Novosphingobium sp. LASN5T]|uniref:EF-hand domain-containing protein n=1 Tax=Novosphingobium sp. LASN5T TaxID=2491021 RepID=UPI000F5F4A96|nr:signal transduction protein [Novosphingobium sp. LASN5T]RQW45657.1 signal transduction protein [Novosphingobium sp. LASN5T]